MNEDKNFLQELQQLKHEIELARDIYLEDNEEINIDVENGLNDAIYHVQDMINHCIELQLAITKNEKMHQFIKDSYRS